MSLRLPRTDQHVKHGYTIDDLHRLTASAIVADRLMAMDYTERWDIAWSAITLALFEAEEPPHRQELVRVGWQAIYRTVRDGVRQRGYADGPREWGSAESTMPRFVQFWGRRVVHSHEDRIVEKVATAQVFATVTGPDREAVIALAVHDDYQRAADALGITEKAFQQRLVRARRVFVRRWFEGETPHRPRRTDRRVEAHGKELATHCGNDHEWTQENTRIAAVMNHGKAGKRRFCRACERDRKARRRSALCRHRRRQRGRQAVGRRPALIAA